MRQIMQVSQTKTVGWGLLSCFRQLSETKLFLVNSWKAPAETTVYDNSVMKHKQTNITMSSNHLKYIFYLKNWGKFIFDVLFGKTVWLFQQDQAKTFVFALNRKIVWVSGLKHRKTQFCHWQYTQKCLRQWMIIINPLCASLLTNNAL